MQRSKSGKRIPSWARNPQLTQSLIAQQTVDPDQVFKDALSGDLDLQGNQ